MDSNFLRKGLLLGGAILLAFTLQAQRGKPAKAAAPTPPATVKTFTENNYDAIRWRQVGPFRGGRAGTVTGVPGHPNLYYMGTAGGGVWRTKDGGQTWDCISDGYFGGSIGAVAVADSDPNVLYVGEGEQTLRGNVSSGRGLWRSTDAGKSWNFIGLGESEHIGRIRVHPTNPDLVYVAAIGNLWKPSNQRGVYRSKDGGKTWERILYVSDNAGAVDLILDPNNPRIIYASTWQIKRNGFRMDSGGPDSHLWKSTDGGDTWTKLTNRPGLPKSTIGIIGIAISAANSNRIYALVEAEDGGMFRSDDAGDTWTLVSTDRELRTRAWYYTRITADPKNEDQVYVCNVSFWRSKDGGRNYERINTPHGDHHDLWVNPDMPERMAIADDGGVQVTTDGGESWTDYYTQPTAQFYRVTTDNAFPYRILGAQQDNSTVRIFHRTPGRTITDRDWEPSAGGESAHLAPDPNNPNIVYAGSYKGYMSRVDHSTGQERSTNVWPYNPAGSGAEVMKYRFNWNFPLFFSPNDSKKLYAGSNYLHATTNGGQTWEVISPDLTRGEAETILSSGGDITQDNTGVEYYATLFAVTESSLEPGVIWAGSDDGLIHVTRDGGKTWTNVTPPASMSPKRNMMNCIDVNPFVKGGAYVAATHYKFGDYQPYLYKTTDYGKTWELITTGIDATHYTRAIRADPKRAGLLYAGTEWGMYISFDDGSHWQPFQLNLPITSIRDLHIRDNALVAATHGRSFWMIDDLTPLHQLDEVIAQKPFYLFQPKPSYRLAQENNASGSALRTAGENHPNGVIFHFFLKEMSDTAKVKLELMEMDGSLIQTYSNTSRDRRQRLAVKSGGNRFIWDMRYPGFTDFPGMVLYSSPNQGPRAVPGNYRARLTVNGQSVEQTFEIIKDPRLPNTPEDYQRQFDFLTKVRDRVSEANQAILDIRSVRKDITYLKEKLGQDPEYKELLRQATDLEKEMTRIENKIHETRNEAQQDPLNFGIRVNNRLAFLMADQQLGDFPPTDQAESVYQQLSNELGGYLQELAPLMKEGINQLNKAAVEKQLPLLREKGSE
ncbi:MAG: glycosyl hydrolase [Lewinellaceae bacterium]|nr:glycosyl hydrolase [Lewinellaceae bacterium]